MHLFDDILFGVYMLVILAVGLYHYKRNKGMEDYYVGGRDMDWRHVGMSVVATDVGGGFSIGLGGLGYTMGLSGSWLLFTGLLGAWLATVLLIPHVKRLDAGEGLLTYPDLLRWRYGTVAAAIAAAISAIGYLGFTGGQVLAGAKLASVTIFRDGAMGMDPMLFSLVIIAGVTVIYTMFGGLKAVIYTDTVQWLVLLGGLTLVALPMALYDVGGWSGLKAALPASHFDLFNISPAMFINWLVTIVPIWFVGMTLYQRIYAVRDAKDVRKAWYMAGLLEWPLMSFMGVMMGMCSRVLFPGVEPETGLPRLIAEVLPVGAAGLVAAAYFSAIMSTADSCMMAASGNVVNDVLLRLGLLRDADHRRQMHVSMLVTGLIGVVAVLLAASLQTVLELILHAYTFMVAGLFIPTLGVFHFKWGTGRAAVVSMVAGGGTALTLIAGGWTLPGGLQASLAGILASLIAYVLVSRLGGGRPATA